ncbi:MAG: hypothetical protein GXY44_01940 [Phycisphaerales bacterium]|nr:hypothetical protein [Phycisphaerales bacterium]
MNRRHPSSLFFPLSLIPSVSPSLAAPFPSGGGGKRAEGRSRPAAGAAAQHAIMFWVLTGLALAVFVPAVILPVWLEREEICRQERAMAGVVAELDRRIQHNEATIQALLSDPLINQRIIRRELNYRPDYEKVIQWSDSRARFLPVYPDTLGESAAALVEGADDGPPWVVILRRWLPAWPWRALFVESPNRELLLFLSGGLLAAAFLLYNPHTAPGAPCDLPHA